MLDKAKAIVREYVEGHLDRTNPDAEYTLFVVWQANILQNYKCLISTTLPHGMYFELTHDGDRGRWYLDVYRKAENREIDDGIYEQPDA